MQPINLSRQAFLTPSTLGRPLLGLAVATLLVTSRAGADEPCGDTTCPQGFVCAQAEVGCPLIECLDETGTECKPCTSGVSYYCEPAPCQSDADCGPDLVCAEQESLECDPASGTSEPSGVEPGVRDSSCPPDTDCSSSDSEAPQEVDCRTVVTRICLPRWQLPCTTDADCGQGFTCIEDQVCSCSGSTGASPGVAAGTAGAGSTGSEPATLVAPDEKAIPPEGQGDDGSGTTDPSCTCEPTGTRHCELVRTACTTDTECLPGWTCQDNPEGVCWVDESGNSGCTTPDPARYCFPPYSDLGFGVSGGTGELLISGEGEPTSVGEAKAVTGSPGAAGGSAVEADAQDGASSPPASSSAGSTDQSASPQDTNAKVARAGSAAGGAASTSSLAPTTKDTAAGGGGCSVGAGSRAGSLLWVLTALAGLLSSRRRAR